MIVRWTEKAHAKVNVSLWVGPRRGDGFHQVTTVLHMLSLHDTLSFEVERTGQATAGGPPPGFPPFLRIDMETNCPSIPNDEGNLAWRAVKLLEPELLRAGYDNVRVYIHKRIPIAAGLAGGSADAAAVLRGLRNALHLPLTDEQLVERAKTLGTDVPACLLGGTLLGIGRGEKVSRLAAGRFFWVLATPAARLSAKEVYDALAEMRARDGRPIRDVPLSIPPSMKEALVAGEGEKLAPFLYNDLQKAVCRLCPSVTALIEVLDRQDVLASLVSGSGPTVVGLVKDLEAAEQVAAALADEAPWVWWGESEVDHGPA